MTIDSTLLETNFDGLSFSGVNTNGGDLLVGSVDTHGFFGGPDVNSNIEATNFNNLSFSGVNTGGGDIGVGSVDTHSHGFEPPVHVEPLVHH